MTHAALPTYARWLVLATGAGDVAAGLALVAAPGAVLPLVGLAVPEGDGAVYLRWVGLYAAALGAAYLLGGQTRAPGALRAVLSLTLPFRLGTGVFVSLAVGRGALAAPWLFVAAINLALVAAQGWLLAKGVDRAD